MSGVLVDTSLLVLVFRDRTQGNAERLIAEIGDQDIVLSRIVAAELLAGAKDEAEWMRIEGFVLSKTVLEVDASAWTEAARLYFDARRGGKTIRKLADCCIAHLAISHGVTLLHNDRDFETIATFRPLKQIRFDLSKA